MGLRSGARVSGRCGVSFTTADQLVVALEQAFDIIHRERMADLPVVKPALTVRAIGFQERNGRWLGVLLTPRVYEFDVAPAR